MNLSEWVARDRELEAELEAARGCNEDEFRRRQGRWWFDMATAIIAEASGIELEDVKPWEAASLQSLMEEHFERSDGDRLAAVAAGRKRMATLVRQRQARAWLKEHPEEALKRRIAAARRKKGLA